MNAADNYSIMTDLITQSSHCVSLLKESLEAELDSLKNNNSDTLIQACQKKESLMLELQAVEQQRKKMVTNHNIKTKEEYLIWLDKLDPSSELKNQWLDLSKEILTCQKQNSTNGIISENMAIASRQALNILSSNSQPVDNTYTANGKKPGLSASLHNTTA